MVESGKPNIWRTHHGTPRISWFIHVTIPSDPVVGQVTSTLETGVPLPSEDERNEALFAVFSVRVCL